MNYIIKLIDSKREITSNARFSFPDMSLAFHFTLLKNIHIYIYLLFDVLFNILMQNGRICFSTCEEIIILIHFIISLKSHL